MKPTYYKSSWAAFILFYIVLLLIVSILDWVNRVLTLSYFATQAGLITLGVAIFVFIGLRMPDLSASRGVLLAFTVGILTIIPAVLMGLGRIPDLWPQYFYIAFGMAGGSFLTFLFLRFSKKLADRESLERED
jgi:hypothetical protein